MCSVKKVFLKILHNSMEVPVPESLFNKVAGLRPAMLLKKRSWHRWFPVNFAKFLRIPSFRKHLWWLLLTFSVNLTVCNLQFMKSPVELNSCLSKFFCYITWFFISPD